MNFTDDPTYQKKSTKEMKPYCSIQMEVVVQDRIGERKHVDVEVSGSGHHHRTVMPTPPVHEDTKPAVLGVITG
jgi:hypothetical protein